MCNDVPGCVEEWHISGKMQVSVLQIANTDHRTTVCSTFLGFRKPLYSWREGMCHSSRRPGRSLHV